MRNSVIVVSLVLVAYLVANSSSAGDQKKPGKDLATLQGKWRVRFNEENYMVIEIKKNSISLTRHALSGPSPTMQGTFTLDETTHPKQMTWKDVQGPGGIIKINRCIYELHGDTCLLIGGGKDLPKHFLSNGNPHTTWILKREKGAK